jgi:hypothetical protein
MITIPDDILAQYEAVLKNGRLPLEVLEVAAVLSRFLRQVSASGF